MSDKSAQQEPWWDQFVAEYGVVPLRELARKYGTNPRRLRRAAQRCGLTDEPLVLRKNTALLGSIPDASVADKLGVTRESVQGARARRRIGAYDNRASKKRPKRGSKRPAEAPRVAKKIYDPPPRRFRPEDAPPPVVVSRGPRGFARAGTERLGAGKLDTLPPALPSTEHARSSRRRRIVTGEGREGGDKKDGPAPAPVAVWRRKAERKPASPPVRTLYDSKLDTQAEASPVLAQVAEAPPPSLKPRTAVKTFEVEQQPKAQTKQVVAKRPEVPAPAPAAPGQYWQARVEVAGQARDLVILAPSLAEAAAHAEEQGRVLTLGRAALLGA